MRPAVRQAVAATGSNGSHADRIDSFTDVYHSSPGPHVSTIPAFQTVIPIGTPGCRSFVSMQCATSTLTKNCLLHMATATRSKPTIGSCDFTKRADLNVIVVHVISSQLPGQTSTRREMRWLDCRKATFNTSGQMTFPSLDSLRARFKGSKYLQDKPRVQDGRS